MNKITVGTRKALQILATPGQIYRISNSKYIEEGNISGVEILDKFLYVAFNKKHSSYQLIDLVTGEFLYDKDIRSVIAVNEFLTNNDAVLEHEIILTSIII